MAWICGSGQVQAETLNFDTAADLSGFTINSSTGTPLLHGSSYGAGSPAGGGLRFKAASSSKSTSVIHKVVTQEASTVGEWQMSVVLNPREVDDISSGESKGEIHFGFTTSTLTSELEKFLHERNPSIGVFFKAEHKINDSGKNRKVEFGLFNNHAYSNNEVVKNSAANFTHFDEWLKLSLTLVRTGDTTFDASFIVESLGTDGIGTPVEVYASAIFSLTHEQLAAAQTAYGAMAMTTDKSMPGIYFDDYTTEVGTLNPPPAPTALEASVVTSGSFTANWTPGAGVRPQGYVLELSKASDNFATGKLIAADGSLDQASGITINTTAISQDVVNLQPSTAYVYRVAATNTAGASGYSDVITFTTLAVGANSSPTLDVIADVGPLPGVAPQQTVTLSGISPGGEPGQTVTITASSSNPAIIPNPVVIYTSPATTAELKFTPAGAEGTAVITVTVDDGQAMDNELARTFSVLVSNPPETLAFDSASDEQQLTKITNSGIQHAWADGVGSGETPGGGIEVTSTGGGGDRGFAAWRSQAYPLTGITLMKTSILINMKELDDIALGDEGKLEFRLGFTPTLNYNASKPHEFLHKNNAGISVSLKGEHKPSDSGKDRKIEAELSFNGEDPKAGKLGLIATDSVNNWLRLTLTVTPMGGSLYGASYTLEDLGEFGSDSPVVILQSPMSAYENATLAAASSFYAAYCGKLDKELTRVVLDDHRVILSNQPPDQPEIADASLVTSSTFTANWQPGVLAYPTGYELQVVEGAADFIAGNFIAASGAGAQADGIAINDGAIHSLRISGLLPGTSYRYRVVAFNINGDSPPSDEASVTTLNAGENAAPTLDNIPPPQPIALNSGEQTVLLSGITAGGEDGQTVTVSAVSSNTALIADPSVIYTSGASIAELKYTPASGAIGNAVITVTVSDGQPNNATLERVFTIRVVDPPPLLEFEDPTQLADLILTESNILVAHATDAGVGQPASGGIVFSGGQVGTDRAAVVVRPTAFDATRSGYMISSMMVNFAEVLNAEAGSKDKGEIRLGFMGKSTADVNKPKDTMHKTNPSLGVKFAVEHEPSSSEKQRKVEAELFGYDGGSEVKSGKIEITGVQEISNWLKVNFYAVRASQNTYYLSYIIEDYGADGSTYQGQVMSNGPFVISNPAFANDSSIFSSFVFSGEKAGSGSYKADRFEAVVNTTAPDAPITQIATGITSDGLTVNWSPASIGVPTAGYIVEICKAGNPFLPGNFISAAGLAAQSEGIRIEDPGVTSLVITGLLPLTNYAIQVRAYNAEDEAGAILNSVNAATLTGPGLAYETWASYYFADEADVPERGGKLADFDHDGVSNFLEYALNLNPIKSDASGMPVADATGDYLRFTFKLRYNIEGLIYEPQTCTNLTGWTNEGVIILDDSQPPDAEGMQTITVEYIDPIETESRRFFRLAVKTTD